MQNFCMEEVPLYLTANLAFLCGKDDDCRCMHHTHLQRPPSILLSPPCPFTSSHACTFHPCTGKDSATLARPACSTMFNGVCMCFYHSVNQHHIWLSVSVPHRQKWRLKDSMKKASSSHLDCIQSISCLKRSTRASTLVVLPSEECATTPRLSASSTQQKRRGSEREGKETRRVAKRRSQAKNERKRATSSGKRGVPGRASC